MKIYLASRFSRIDEMRKYADELKEDGHEITASWVYGGEEGLTFTDIATLDIADVRRCDAIVSFTEPYGSSNPGGGRHTEFGLGIAFDKLLYLVGEREQVFHWHPSVVQFPQFKHLRNHLSKFVKKDNNELLGISGKVSGFASGFYQAA